MTTNTDEMWRPVVGYEGRYEVSSKGKVRSLLTNKTLSPALNRGYEFVCLTKNYSSMTRRVHILVAEAFFGVRPQGRYVAHNDGNKRNNAVQNLRYATAKENSLDRWKHGTMNAGENSARSKLKQNEVDQIRGLLKTKTQKEIAAMFNVSQTAISYIKTGKRWRGASTAFA